MTSGPQRQPVISDGLPSQLLDLDPAETQEWRESLDAVVEHAGAHRARYLMLGVLQRARERQVGVPSQQSTHYINTIPPEREPWFPGDEQIERRIRAMLPISSQVRSDESGLAQPARAAAKNRGKPRSGPRPDATAGQRR